MKYSGRARQAALRLISRALLVPLIFAGISVVLLLCGLHGPASSASTLRFWANISFEVTIAFTVIWVLFTIFTFYFFRDPDPRIPTEKNLVVSPSHGTVDLIDETTEPLFIGGPCKRISIFLSVLNVHVQNAPVSGKIAFYKYTTGQFINAMKADSAVHNENLLFGIEASENSGTKIGIRLIAGLIARRIVPFIGQGENTNRGERISLIQFGSRTDLYLPLSAKIKVKLGDKTVGGETIMAVLE